MTFEYWGKDDKKPYEAGYQYPDYRRWGDIDLYVQQLRRRSQGIGADIGEEGDGIVETQVNYIEEGYAWGRFDRGYKHEYNDMLDNREFRLDHDKSPVIGRVLGWLLAAPMAVVGATAGAVVAAGDWAFGDDDPGRPVPYAGPADYLQPAGRGR